MCPAMLPSASPALKAEAGTWRVTARPASLAARPRRQAYVPHRCAPLLVPCSRPAVGRRYPRHPRGHGRCITGLRRRRRRLEKPVKVVLQGWAKTNGTHFVCWLRTLQKRPS